jgi:endonuclease/exonuclease/phosphatase family metal-dependent hydrolase
VINKINSDPDNCERIAIKFMTYNIRNNNARDGMDSWQYRRQNVADVINEVDPDILCVQEAYLDQMNYLAALQQFSFVGYGRDDGDTSGEYAAIFYRNARFLPVKCGRFWLSPTPDEPSFGWGANHRRMATWSQLLDELTNRRFLVICTHLDHEFEEARVNGVDVVRSWVRSSEVNNPIVFAGDFNDGPGGAALQRAFLDFSDSRVRSESKPEGPEGTFNGFDLKNRCTSERIDYILLKGDVSVISHNHVDQLSSDGRYPSDHYPVIAELLI